MKKLAVLCMALLLIVSTMAGCNSKPAEGDASTVILQEGYTLQSIIDKMNEEIGIQMPMTVDDAVLEDIFHVNPDDIEEYYGIFGGSMTSADNAVAVKAKEGKADAIFSLFLFYRHCIPSVSFRTIALIHSLLHNSRKDYVFHKVMHLCCRLVQKSQTTHRPRWFFLRWYCAYVLSLIHI